jgi:hypothetical protein
VLDCTENRATLLGVGTISAESALLYRIPLPEGLDGVRAFRALTMTLAWFRRSIRAIKNTAWRRSMLLRASNQKYWIAPDRALQPTDRAIARGTVFHERRTGEAASVFVDEGHLLLRISCRAPAGHLPDQIPLMPIELPEQLFCSSPQNCADTSTLAQGSIFFIDGSSDVISPSTQPAFATGLQSIAAYYSAVPAGIMKVKGTLIGPTHCDVQGSPNCTAATIPCLLGVYGYLGYPTAWMMFQLQNDNYARGAFVNGTGELFSETTNWQLVASTIL